MWEGCHDDGTRYRIAYPRIAYPPSPSQVDTDGFPYWNILFEFDKIYFLLYHCVHGTAVRNSTTSTST